MQDLHQKNMHRGHRTEHTIPTDIAQVAANLLNRRGCNSRRHIGLELTQHLRDSKGHPWPPVGKGRLTTPF